MDRVWLRPGDWYTPAAEAVTEALAANLDAAPAVYRLGQARAAAGVGITEAIDDVGVLFESAGYGSAPVSFVRALCQGWTEGSPDVTGPPAMKDAESGLGTSEYLVQRLAEVYGAAAREGTRVPRTHALIMVDVSTGDADPWKRMTRNAAIGDALLGAYGPGFPIARLGNGLYAVLVARDDALGEGLAELRNHISDRAVQMRVDDLLRQPPRVWVESLPETHSFVPAVIEGFQR